MTDKQDFIADVTIFCIYSLLTFLCIISYLKRELYIFQDGNYSLSEYAHNIRKNYRRYIFPFVLFTGQIILLATRYEEIYYKGELLYFFLICNVITALANRPYGKLLKNTSHTRKIMIIFFIFTVIIFRISVLWSYDESWCKCGMDLISHWFCNMIPYIIVNFALYSTPMLICLSHLLTIPFYSIKKYKEII